MDKEQRLWISVLSVTCGTIVMVAVTMGLYWTTHNKQIAQLILSEGLNPLEVRCALEDSHGTQKVCILLAAKSLNRP